MAVLDAEHVNGIPISCAVGIIKHKAVQGDVFGTFELEFGETGRGFCTGRSECYRFAERFSNLQCAVIAVIQYESLSAAGFF